MTDPRPHADVPGMKLPTPRTPDPASAPGLRWGLLGAGWIAEQMTIALQGTSQQVVAVGSRDLGRAQAFAAAPIAVVAGLLVIFSIALLATVEVLRRRGERLRGLTPA